MTAIELRDISHTYERWGYETPALENVSCTLREGEWTTILGANGSGKSTLLKVISGEIGPTRGSVQVFGMIPERLSVRERANLMFSVSQDPFAGTVPGLTVVENLAVADPGFLREGAQQSRLRYAQLLAEYLPAVGLDQPIEALSGGERQAVTLLIAGLRPARVILLDEPLRALDRDRAVLCLAAIRMLREQGKTIVFVSHQPRIILAETDRFLGLKRGRLVVDQGGVEKLDDLLRILFENG